MNERFFKITEANPAIEMEIGALLGAAGLEERFTGSPELFAALDGEGGLLALSGARDLEEECLIEFIAVRRDGRGKGTGSRLMGRVLGYFAGRSRRAWLFSTTGSAGFFERFGFESILPDRVPGQVRDSRAVAGIEIAGTVPMLLALPSRWPVI